VQLCTPGGLDVLPIRGGRIAGVTAFLTADPHLLRPTSVLAPARLMTALNSPLLRVSPNPDRQRRRKYVYCTTLG
jgi:hypothetical protein